MTLLLAASGLGAAVATTIAASTTDAPIPSYGYGAAGVLVAALLAFSGRYFVRTEKANDSLRAEVTRLQEARLLDATTTRDALADAIAAVRENTRISEHNSNQIDRLTDRIDLLTREPRSVPRRRTTTRGS